MDYPQRKNPRISYYDYTTNNYYFVTICTHQHKCLFWSDGRLNRFGIFARDLLLDIPNHVMGVSIDNCVVMPNHVHAIIVIDRADSMKVRSLSQIISQYKSAVSREVHQVRPNITLWQRSFYDHIIRNQQSYEEIWSYIQYNPQKWVEDKFHPRWNQ